MTNMGARVARMFRNVNLENRAMREISKEKPVAAPRHKTEVLPEVRGVDGESEHLRTVLSDCLQGQSCWSRCQSWASRVNSGPPGSVLMVQGQFWSSRISSGGPGSVLVFQCQFWSSRVVLVPGSVLVVQGQFWWSRVSSGGPGSVLVVQGRSLVLQGRSLEDQGRSLVLQETEVTESIHVKNDPLLSLLKTVYVQSKDPAQASQPPPPQRPSEEDAERRPLKFSLPGDQFGLPEITDVPKGRLSLVEALKALNAHKTSPATWTAQKVAEEYCLALHHTEALLKFFVPFDVMIIPPKSDAVKEIKDS
ncbi:hypothetical protein NHX12_026662 [Muraenolepis orangiensis]|uniref:NADH dehydrogenase [ubiquinone] 1 alpha subcomplex assembly factor 4 n=1 Tax=Muraenolepis orangiensis TaxID=630683 RepID=A0A9Q0EJ16_9TELE|nr:hypothetical protein NHX12_026662 [Muraenolepis orangiensis]